MADDLISELVLCARYGETEELLDLLKENPTLSPSSKNESGQTALHMAAANDHLETLQALISKMTPEQLDTTNNEGNTALHWASLNGNLEVVKALMFACVDPTIKNSANRTALYEAQQRGHDAVVDYLLSQYEPAKVGTGEGSDEEFDDDEEVPEGTVFRAGCME